MAPEYLGEHLRYVLGASLFKDISPVESLEWNYQSFAPLYPDFIPGENVSEWVREEGSILLQHQTEPDEYPKVEFIRCHGHFEWNQPIIRLPQWKLKGTPVEKPPIEGHDMAVTVRVQKEGKILYLMRPQKEMGIAKPLVTGALFAKINKVKQEPFWNSLRDRIMDQAIREPMDGSRLSGWRYLAAIELDEGEADALEIPEDYQWLDESQIAYLLEQGDLHDGFLEACSLFKLSSKENASLAP